jgi:transposase
MRYELTDHEWAAIKPMLPNKPRGVPRVNDRRVLKHHFVSNRRLTDSLPGIWK